MWQMLMEILSNLYFTLLHVTGAGSFPKPLTTAEESEFLERMRKGDKKAREALIERNLRLVAHIIKNG